MRIAFICITILVLLFDGCSHSQARSSGDKISSIVIQPIQKTTNKYCWLTNYNINDAIVNRIAVPEGFKRVEVKQGSFADWLHFLPLKPGNPDVHLYNGELKKYQQGHYAVVDVDIGNTDLQQCADAVIRMRAEYLYSIKEYENLHFNFTSGNTIGFKKWSEGDRTVVKGNNVTWANSSVKGDSYDIFRDYLNTVFNYAGTSSLSKELKPVTDLKNIQIGDVFIVGGFPGHAVLVIDICENQKTGEKLFMIQQSYMPAQEIHILKNFNNIAFSPWYSINFEEDLKTPEWTFNKGQLMRWQ
jgi:hypothetical protein